MGTEVGRDDATSDLSAYVPDLLVTWLRDTPTSRWQRFDATLVFVDVSGFTRLSERLARAGNIGAEELSDTIATCFAVLLEVASTAGGSLLKFGGDALLLLFAEDGHEARGCQAAVGMRAALRELGDLQTSAGPVTLRMSIGVNSGPVHAFVVGDSHHELIVAGPGATGVVTMEGAADAGQIVVSPTTAERLDRTVIGAPRGPGYLLTGTPASATAAVGIGTRIDRATLLSALPAALRTHLGSGRRDAEHRRVTVAFLQFQGTDRLIELEGPDAAAEQLDAMIRSAQRGADTHDVTFLGTDVDADGGKVLLASGAPVSFGNDEERMLLTLRDIIEYPATLPFKVGVHAGHVFAGDIGPATRRSYTVMGDAVNLAARLMGRTRPGAILATAEVLDPSRTTFATTQLDPFLVKGKSEPVIASTVGPVVGSRPAEHSHHGELPFVGREAELTVFDEVMAAALNGQGCLLEVVGEAGIGKSRLLAAFRDRTTDRPVAQLVCELHRASTPYGAVRKLLRTLIGTSTDAPQRAAADELLAFIRNRVPHLLEWAPLLAIAYGTELPATSATANLDERFLRPRLNEAVLELLTVLWPGPMLLTVEDIQWMDEASAELFRALAPHLPDRPWVLCLTRRGQDPSPAGGEPATLLMLEPLDGSATEALASAATDASPLTPHEMSQLVDRSAGNPLFLQELVIAAQQAGGVASLPGSVEALMTARIDRLPPDLRDLLREVSVLGYSFPRDLADQVVTDGASAQLPELADFLATEGDLVRFRHAMTRDAAYGGLPYRRRRALHAKAGDTIAADQGDRPELLSFHFHLAERYEDAWRTSLAAGRRAAEVYANTEAARFFERALDAARRLRDLDPVEVAHASDALGDALQRMGEIERAGEIYQAAARAQRDDPIAWAGLLLKVARVKAQLKWYSQALATITRGVTRLDGLATPEARAQRAQLMVWYAHLRLEQGRPADGIRWSNHAIEEAEGCGERDALAHAYRLLDWAYAERGQLDLAVHSERALALYEELDDLGNQASVLNNLGVFAYWAGDWTRALEYYQRAITLLDQVGDVIGAALGRSNTAEILADQGRWEEASSYFRDAERAVRAAGFRSGIAFVRANLGRTAARAGRFEEAEELLEEARQGALEVGAATQVVEAEARLAELHVFRGQPDQALGLLEDALRRSDAKEGVAAQGPLLHRVRGYALMQRGDVEAARAALSQSFEAAEARDAEYERALAQRALAELAAVTDGEEDAALTAASQQTFDALGVERLPVIPRDHINQGSSAGIR